MDKLKSKYAIDPQAAEDGVWVTLHEGAEVLVARFNNPRHRKVLERLRRPYKNMMRSGQELPEAVQREITNKSMAECVLLGWRGETFTNEDGSPIPYSYDKALEYLSDPEMEDFANQVSFIALSGETYRKQSLEDAAKNSGASSAGNASEAEKPESSQTY